MATFDVLMPVKNGITYLREAIESIRQQTLSDWRLFVLDHASTDGSLELAQEFADADHRLVVVPFPAELTFSALLNAGLDLCDAKYVLRQDADDISLPHRMQVLADAFQADPELVLVGSQGNVIDGTGRQTGRFHMPVSPERIAALSLFRIPVLHPAAAMRLAAIKHRGVRYGNDFIQAVPEAERLEISGLAEDYFLFGQLALTARCRNVGERLLNFRWHANNISIKKEMEQLRMAVVISRYLARSYALLRNVAQFDPAPMCNHGYRLVKFRDRDDFRTDFVTMRDSLLRGLGRSDDLEKELAFRSCLVSRRSVEMLFKYVSHAAAGDTDRSEWYTIKSWIIHQAKTTYLNSGSTTLLALD